RWCVLPRCCATLLAATSRRIQKKRCCINHLRSESFGISLLEGAIFSKPLISCEIGTGTTFINIDKETGIVIEPSNCDELKKAMDTLWNSPVLAEEYGKKARIRYEEIFSANSMIKGYVELYNELLSKS
ncbi:glycosyltransferase, partial [Rahnella sp. PD12R]|uniref:glycosyltransferase n=1 Tax=Rahnella sp. PD12R TaxID=2855688 RepID=UPI001C45A7D6